MREFARSVLSNGFVLVFAGMLIVGALVAEAAEKQTPKKESAAKQATKPAAGAPAAPRDARFSTFRQGRDYPYTFPTYASKEAWEKRAAELRRHILVTTGLWPMPKKYALSPHIYGMKVYDDYSVAKVYFESYPDFYVTGNLYRPNRPEYTGPGVISPHGHWKNGRLENGERGSVPGRCINLARQGHVVFSYDMIGYNDSLQLDHKFRGDRQDLWGISLMGLQLWNSIRAIDFLRTLPDVDPERIGCTGASGGGTQTFMVMAVDDRVKCAAPVNMISAHFQGGCLCENAPNLRLDTFNVEIGALMAPRPLLMVSASGDWTKNTPTVEYPAIASIYKLYGVPENVYQVQVDAPHNYNKTSREAVYAWFGKHLLGQEGASTLKEKPFHVESDKDLRIFENREDLPYRAATADSLVDYLIRKAKEDIASAVPKNPDAIKALADSLGSSLKHSLNIALPGKDALAVTAGATAAVAGGKATSLTIGRKSIGDRVPATLFEPAKPGKAAAVIVHEKGQAALMGDGGKGPGPLVAGLLTKGHTILTLDAFETGQAVSNKAEQKARSKVAHFTTFNRTVLANRAQDILTAMAVLQHRDGIQRVDLVGLGDAGLWALLARSQSGLGGRTVIDAGKFDYDDDAVFVQRFFCPGLRRAGDFGTAMAMSAPGPLYVTHYGPGFPIEWARPAFPSQEQKPALIAQEAVATNVQIIEWLTKE